MLVVILVNDFIVKCESSLKKNNRKLKILEDENLELSTHNDHLSKQVERSKMIEDKLRDELAMSKRNEEGLKRELNEAKESLSRMTTSTKKLDHILGVRKNPFHKKGIGYEDSKEISTPTKTIFVKSLGKIEASPVHTPRKKIDLGQCSRSAQVKEAPRRQPQA